MLTTIAYIRFLVNGSKLPIYGNHEKHYYSIIKLRCYFITKILYLKYSKEGLLALEEADNNLSNETFNLSSRNTCTSTWTQS